MQGSLAQVARRMATSAPSGLKPSMVDRMISRQNHDVAKINDKLNAVIARQKNIHWLTALTFGNTFGHVLGPSIANWLGANPPI